MTRKTRTHAYKATWLAALRLAGKLHYDSRGHVVGGDIPMTSRTKGPILRAALVELNYQHPHLNFTEFVVC